MNDAYYEQLVARKPRPADMLIRILAVLLIPVIALFGMQIIGMFAFMLAVIYAIIAWYLILPRLNVEYEYDLLNHDMQIDAIYSKSSRKKKLSIDIQQAEIIAPKGSPRLNSYQPGKTYDFSSGDVSARVYSIMIPAEQTLTCVQIEPDEKMTELMSGWMGSKMYRN